MKKHINRVLSALAGLVLCMALLVITAVPAKALVHTWRSEIYLKEGDTYTFQYDFDNSAARMFSGEGYARAGSTNTDILTVSNCWANNRSQVVSVDIKALRPGTATVLITGINLTMQGYDDPQALQLYITVNVAESHRHNYTQSLDTPATTCTNGYYRYYCSCGDSYYTTIYAPHAYGDAVVTQKPTADADGVQTQTCTECGKTKDTAIDKSHAAHFNTQPQSAYAKVGSKAAVSVDAGGDGLKYQWYIKNYGSSSFGKSSIKSNTYSVTMDEANTGRKVYCEITDQYGNKVKSNTVTLYSDALIKTQPVSTSAYRDDRASVSVEAVGQGLTYEWYIKSASGKTFSKSSVTNKSYSFVMDDARDGRQAYCIVKDQHGNEVKSTTVTFTMKERPVFITQQPKSVKVFEGEKASVSLKATGKEMSYQWYYKDPGMTKFAKTSTFKSNSYSVSMDESRDGRKVYCVITDYFGNKTTSDTVTLSMKHTAKIVTQPKNASAVNGEKVSTTVKAAGDGLTYQWYIKSASGTTFSKSSVTGATYSTTMSATANGRKVYCVVTDKYGNSVTTNTVTLKRANVITVTQQPQNVTVADGKKATVSFKAEGDGLTYTWYYKNPGASKFSKTTSFKGATYSVTMSPDRDGRQVYCLITDKYGTTQKTNTVTLRMEQYVNITAQPKEAWAYEGNYAKTTVTATGDGLTYQWYIASATGTKFSKSSITAASYSAKMAASSNGRKAYCVVTDKYGNTATTDIVTLNMAAPLAIVTQPKNVTELSVGDKATVSFEATGTNLTYTWYYKNDGAEKFSTTTTFKNNTYSITVDESRDGRQVYCVITDATGTSVTTNTVGVYLTPSGLNYNYYGTNSEYVSIKGYSGTKTALIIPEKLNGRIVKTISSDAFRNNTSLTKISIPQTVGWVGSGVFNACTNLTSVTLPNSITEIHNYTFMNCHSLTSIKLPSGITKIGADAFYNCYSLSSINIPYGVTIIDNTAFYGCKSLTSVTIPSSVDEIWNEAFAECTNLTTVTIPSSVSFIGRRAFYGCDNLTIRCKLGSTAHNYCIDRDIPYELY